MRIYRVKCKGMSLSDVTGGGESPEGTSGDGGAENPEGADGDGGAGNPDGDGGADTENLPKLSHLR